MPDIDQVRTVRNACPQAHGPDKPAPCVDFSEWHSLIRERFVALDITPDDHDGFRGSVTTTPIGHLSLSRVRSVQQAFRRTPRLVARHGEDMFQVGLVTRGAAQLEQDGRTCLLSPGSFAVYETCRPFIWRMVGDWELTVCTWPRHTIALDVSETSRMTAIPSGSNLVDRVVGGAIAALQTHDGPLGPASAVRLADEVADLVVTAGLERSGRPADEISPAVLAEIYAYIEDNLTDPQLSAGSVARAFHMSTRTLQRTLARDGKTAVRWIRSRRLGRARRELALRHEHGMVGTIAGNCGFSDVSAFSRLFKQAYGVAPSHYRREVLLGAGRGRA